MQEKIWAFLRDPGKNYSQIVCALILINSTLTLEWQKQTNKQTNKTPKHDFTFALADNLVTILPNKMFFQHKMTDNEISDSDMFFKLYWKLSSLEHYALCAYYVPGMTI